jgi:hypothetical protein
MMPQRQSTPSTRPISAQPVPIFSTVTRLSISFASFSALPLEEFLAVENHGCIEDGHGEYGHCFLWTSERKQHPTIGHGRITPPRMTHRRQTLQRAITARCLNVDLFRGTDQFEEIRFAVV